MHEIYDTRRNPKVTSFACAAVLEVITFPSKIQRNILTTHIKLWEQGELVKVYEINGSGGTNCKRVKAEEQVVGKFSIANFLNRTKHGHMKAYREYPSEIIEAIEDLCEAIYKPRAAQIRYVSHMIGEN